MDSEGMRKDIPSKAKKKPKKSKKLFGGRDRSESTKRDLTSEQSVSLSNGDSEDYENRQPLEGLLYKYTNVMKGWQTRWFVLNPESGRLEYFEKEEHKKQRPRGAVHLMGAVISPSDEDSQTFTVNTAASEAYRLRASDARERQHWVNRLRATAEFHTATIAQNAPPLPKEVRPMNFGSVHSLNTSKQDGSLENIHSASSSIARSPKILKKSYRTKEAITRPRSASLNNLVNVIGIKVHKNLKASLLRAHKTPAVVLTQTNDAFRDVKDMLDTCQSQEEDLSHQIEVLPNSGEHINALDQDILLLKATSKSTLMCLEQCLQILQQQQQQQHQQPMPLAPQTDSTIDWLDPKAIPMHHGSRSAPTPGSPAESFVSAADLPIAMEAKPLEETIPIDHDEEVEDDVEYTDTELGGVEEHKSIILHLLSQLKLGMDLTKVVLPTFILEKRSLLEMFADCMAHPDLFLRIPDQTDPESRMIAVLEWYLTSFHASRKGAVAKKPYNPIIGETFYCSWKVPQEDKAESEATAEVPGQTAGSKIKEDHTRLYYCAEQVSHHPPISAFYFECPEKMMSMNASVWTKSKFMGMSIGVVMVGKVSLNLLDYDEEYQFTLPSAYARSILTVPWVELGDRVTISCPKTNYSASVVFHTKPFYGGKLHRVTAEVKNPAGEIVSRTNGEWNSVMELTLPNGQTKELDTSKLNTLRKHVRPLDEQLDNESRKLWQNVTESLKAQDIENATHHKRFLEERQRQGERHRREKNKAFPTKHFHLSGDTWVYNSPLTLGQTKTSI